MALSRDYANCNGTEFAQEAINTSALHNSKHRKPIAITQSNVLIIAIVVRVCVCVCAMKMLNETNDNNVFTHNTQVLRDVQQVGKLANFCIDAHNCIAFAYYTNNNYFIIG